MEKDEFVKEVTLEASPEQVYKAWLNGKQHGEMIGGEATGQAIVGAEHSAWDGYITGKNIELEPHRRILQTWRTTEFASTDEDSMLEVLLQDQGNTCQLTLKHWNIPLGQGKRYFKGWDEHYFEPMTSYFNDLKEG